MKKVLRTAAWAAAGLALALAAAAIGLKLYFTQARLRALVDGFAARDLHRQLTFSSVSLGLSGLSIDGLRVSEYPDFRRGEFFSAESFSVRPSLRALLRGELVINSVSADGLDMRVQEVKKDTYNFSDLVSSGTARAAGRPAARRGTARKMYISSLRVRNSRFSYASAAGDMKVTLRGIDLSASAISPDGLFPARGSFTVDVASRYLNASLPVSLNGRLSLGNFRPARGRAELDKAEVSLGGVKAELKGSLAGLTEPDARIRLDIKPFSTADLRPVFRGLPAKILLPEVNADADLKLTSRSLTLRSVALKAGPVKATLKGLAAWDPAVSYDISADVSAQVPEMDTTLLARKARQFPVPAGLKLPYSEVSASLTLRDGKAYVRSYSLRSSPFDADGSALLDLSGPAARASGSVKLELKDLAKAAEVAPARLAGYALSGSGRAEADYSWNGSLALKGRASLKNAGASLAGHKLSGLSCSVDFTRDSAASKDISGRLDGADMKASFSARSITTHPKAQFDLKLARLLIKDLPRSGAADAQPPAQAKGGTRQLADIAGRAEIGSVESPYFNCGQVSARLDLYNASADLKDLDGSASFSAGPGRFSELYKLAERSKAAKVALSPLTALQKAGKAGKALGLPDLNNADFEKIEGDYSFSRGLMKLNRSALVSASADASSTGTINLPDGRLDLRAELRLKKGPASEPVTMTIKGTMDSPSVKPDVRSIAAQPAVQKAVDKLVPGASKLLKGLLKK